MSSYNINYSSDKYLGFYYYLEKETKNLYLTINLYGRLLAAI